jgi:hypothetical protein
MLHIYAYVCVSVCMCVCMYVRTCVLCVFMCICVHIYMHVCLCLYVCIYVCIYIYVHTRIYALMCLFNLSLLPICDLVFNLSVMYYKQCNSEGKRFISPANVHPTFQRSV